MRPINLTENNEEKKEQRLKIFHTFFFPALFLFLMWMVHFSLLVFEVQDAYKFGVFPHTIKGLKGILFYPLIHGGWGHLFSNSVPVFVLGAGLFYFYKSIAYRTFFGVYFFSGILLWIIGRNSYHVGASGIVYGLVSFLFISGLLRKQANLMAFSLFVVFLYGSLVWGLLPIDPSVSFEGHLAGGLTGAFFAWYYRKAGPQAKPIVWEEEEGENGNEDWRIEQLEAMKTFEENNPPTILPDPKQVEEKKEIPAEPKIRFIYTEKKSEEKGNHPPG